jgi:hypothetical protein
LWSELFTAPRDKGDDAMPRRVLTVLLMTILLAAAAVLAGDDSPSGPKSGDKIPGSFHPFNITGKYKDKFHCLVCQYGLSPVAAVFVRGDDVDDGLLDLLKELDKAVAKYDRANFRSFAVFLDKDILDDDKRAAPAEDAWKDADVFFKDDDRRMKLAKKLTQEVQEKAELKNVVLSLYNEVGPKGWNLPRDKYVTVVLYRNHLVVESKSFGKDELKDAYAMLAPLIQKMATEKK